MKYEITEGSKSMRHPQPDGNAALAMPEPQAADYCDEITDEQLIALRAICTQDEAAMGPLVHEFRW